MAFYSLITGGALNNGTLGTDALFAVCCVILLGRFELRPRVLLARAAEAVALFIVQCSLDVVCSCLGISDYPSPTLVALFAALGGYALLQVRLTLVDRVARAATFMAIFALVVVITRTIMPATGGLRDLWFGYSIPSLFSYISMLISAFFIRYFSVEEYLYVPWKYLVLLVAIDLLGAMAGWSFVELHNTYDFLDNVQTSGSFLVGLSRSVSQVNIVVCASFVALVILAYFMFRVLAQEHDRRAEALVSKRSDTDNASVASATKSMYDSMREMRHEIKNHDAYMLSLLDAGDYGALREFLTTYAVSHEGVTHYVSSGNHAVDAVVNAKVALARSRGLEIKTMLAVPDELPYAEDDVFCLLANLLDNAIEGAAAAGASRAIQLKVMPEAGYFFFSVTNPCDPSKVRRGRNGSLLTTKKDPEVHGYGTKAVRHIAEKYHGSASFRVQGDVFVASVMLARGAGEGAE